MANGLYPDDTRTLTEEAVRKWSEGIREELDKKRWRFQRQVLWKYVSFDIAAPIVALLFSISAWWASGFNKIEPEVPNDLYMSVLQGFCALVAIIFAFVAFTYRRGEQQIGELGSRTLEDIRALFKNVEMSDETDVRIWFHLYDEMLLRNSTGLEKQKSRFNNANRNFGKYLYENSLANSLPIRTILVLLPFVIQILVTAALLADVITGTYWAAFLVLGVLFSVVWFFWFAWRVLSAINRRSDDLYKKEMKIRPVESEILRKEFGIVLDEIDQVEVKHFVNFDVYAGVERS